MPSQPRSERHPITISDPTVILFICISAALIIVPVLVTCVVCYRRWLRRGRKPVRETGNTKLRELKLQTLQPSSNAAAQRQTTRGTDDNAVIGSTSPCRTQAEKPKMSSRLTRPIHLPIRLSTIRPRQSKLDPTSKPILPTHKSTSETSLVSSLSSYSANVNDNHPPSPLSPSTSIVKPEPSHQRDRAPARNARGSSVYSLEWYVKDDLSATRDNRLAPRDLGDERGELVEVRLEMGEVKTTREARTRGRQRDDGEWREVRMETVDGVLAPREWV